MALTLHDLIVLAEAAIDEREMGAVQCGNCGYSSDDYPVRNVIDHVQHDHVHGAPLMIVERTELISTYEMQLLVGGAARTEHEEKWRTGRALAAVEGRLHPGE